MVRRLRERKGKGRLRLLAGLGWLACFVCMQASTDPNPNCSCFLAFAGPGLLSSLLCRVFSCSKQPTHDTTKSRPARRATNRVRTHVRLSFNRFCQEFPQANTCPNPNKPRPEKPLSNRSIDRPPPPFLVCCNCSGRGPPGALFVLVALALSPEFHYCGARRSGGFLLLLPSDRSLHVRTSVPSIPRAGVG